MRRCGIAPSVRADVRIAHVVETGGTSMKFGRFHPPLPHFLPSGRGRPTAPRTRHPRCHSAWRSHEDARPARDPRDHGPGRPAIAAGAAPPGRPHGHQQPDRRGRRARRRPVAHPPDALRERVRHRGTGRLVEPGPRAEGPARPDPAGRGRLRRGPAQPAPPRPPLPARRAPAGGHQGGPAGRRAEGPRRRERRRGQGHGGVGVDRPGRGPPRPSPRLGRHLGRLGRPGPGPLEGPQGPHPGRAPAVRLQAAGPRHRRPGLDRAVDPGGVPRPVHDHPAAGLPGDVPGRRYRALLVRLGPAAHPRARAAGRPLPGLQRRRHLVEHAGPGPGDQGGRHAVLPRAGPQRPGRSWGVPGWGAGAGGSRAKAIA